VTLSDEDQLAEDKYRKELMLKTSDEIGELVAIERQKVAQEQESARFFNAEEANANVDHWAKMPYWSVDEAVALLLGKEPEIVNWKKLKGMVGSSPFSKTYSKLLDLANRSVAAGIMQEDDLPNRFLQWAEKMNHDVPRALIDACAKYSSEMVPRKVLYEKLGERLEHEIPPEKGSAEWRREIARNAAEVRHNKPGGSRDKKQQIQEIWASGKFTSRDICAEQECASLGMSITTARRALNNTPNPPNPQAKV